MLPTSLPDGSPYDVTVASQPANQVCSVTNGRGAIEKAEDRLKFKDAMTGIGLILGALATVLLPQRK